MLISKSTNKLVYNLIAPLHELRIYMCNKYKIPDRNFQSILRKLIGWENKTYGYYHDKKNLLLSQSNFDSDKKSFVEKPNTTNTTTKMLLLSQTKFQLL